MLLAHYDWSMHPAKRWQTTAVASGSSKFRIVSSCHPPPPAQLFAALRSQAGSSPIFAGFDVPIGLPQAYAQQCAITSFLDALPLFGQQEWAEFYSPSTLPSDIKLTRPFYPQRPGGAKKIHQLEALGLNSLADLLRICEQATANRPKACELFWTLGANQVGKATITAWRDLLAPALQANEIAIWPFAGPFATLLQPPRIAVAEVYPAEYYSRFGIPNRFGKTTQQGRAAQAAAILHWCKSNQVQIPPQLHLDIEAGFHQAPTGEDQFDSLIGLLGMMEAVRNPAKITAPELPNIQNVEGWILGTQAG